MSRFPSPFAIDFVARTLAAAPLTIVDVGCAGGIDPLWRRYEKEQHLRYFGFEPNPSEFDQLKSRANTQFFPYAVSDSQREDDFYAFATFGGLRYRPEAETDRKMKFDRIRVKVETLSNLRATGVLPSVDVLKSDTEGHDLSVLHGLGDYFPELLCVKSETLFAAGPGENAFSDIDQYLRAKSFTLFGFQFNLGYANEPFGGDAIFVRDVWSIVEADLADEIKAQRIAKLICICFFLRNMEYAYIVARVAAEAKIISPDDLHKIQQVAGSVAYLPNVLPSWATALGLSHLFSMLSQVAAGRRVGNKSVAKDNRFDRYRRLYIPVGIPGVRDRLRQHLETRYNNYIRAKAVRDAEPDVQRRGESAPRTN